MASTPQSSGRYSLQAIAERIFSGSGQAELTCPHGRPVSMGPCWACEMEALNHVST